MRTASVAIIVILACITSPVTAQRKGTAANPHILNPTPTTVAWGHYWSETPPALKINSGDVVRLHTLITSNPERLEAAGLPAAEVEKELRDVQSVRSADPAGIFSPDPSTSKKQSPAMCLRSGSCRSISPFRTDTMPSARMDFFPMRFSTGR